MNFFATIFMFLIFLGCNNKYKDFSIKNRHYKNIDTTKTDNGVETIIFSQNGAPIETTNSSIFVQKFNSDVSLATKKNVFLNYKKSFNLKESKQYTNLYYSLFQSSLPVIMLKEDHRIVVMMLNDHLGIDEKELLEKLESHYENIEEVPFF